jgi:SAM-dependent methyltransferase
VFRQVRLASPILDVGAGPGFLEEKITAIALDINLDDLKKFHGPRVLASGDSLPFVENAFRTVFCMDTAHLLKNPSELARVLAPDGQVIASLPCSKWNSEEKTRQLLQKFSSLEPVQKFIIRTEREWDAVVVFSKAQVSRKPRKAR